MLDELSRGSSDTTKTNWTAEEDEDLQAAVEEHGAGNWAASKCLSHSRLQHSLTLYPPPVSLFLTNVRSPAACYHRYTQSLQPSIKRGTWTPSEDTKLRDAVALYGQKWSRVKDLLPGRTAPQCRERYVRVLTVGDVNGGYWTKGVSFAVTFFAPMR